MRASGNRARLEAKIHISTRACADHNARSVHFFIRQLVRGLKHSRSVRERSQEGLDPLWAGEQPVSFSGVRVCGGSAVVRARKIDLISFLRDAGRKGRRRLGFLRFAIRPARPC